MRQRPTLLAALALFAAGGLLLLVLPMYPAVDLLAYVSVAQKYAAGNLAEAINGCWSPLGSWLLVPFLWAGIDPLIGCRIVHLLVGGVTLFGVSKLSQRFEMSDPIRTVVVLVAAPLLLVFYYIPDLLICTAMVFYLHHLLAEDYAERPRRGLWCGAFGALAFLGKSYGMPIFLLHFSIANVMHRLRGGRVLRSYGAGLLAFALIASPWIAALSVKYGQLTTNTVGAYTYAVIGPDYPAHPTFFEGFFAPPNDTAISAWEDPSLIPVHGWSPFDSLQNLRHQVKLIRQACDGLLESYNGFTGLWIAILLFYLLRCIPLREGLRTGDALPLMTVLIYPAGYLVTHLDPWLGRYVWINALLLLLMGGHAVHVLAQHGNLGRLRTAVLLTAVAGSFAPGIARSAHRIFTTAAPEYAAGVELGRALQLAGAPVASNAKIHKSTYLTYRVGGRYFGAPAPDVSAPELQRQLAELEVEYFIYWRDAERGFRGVPEFLLARPDVTAGKHPLFRIYELRDSR